MLFRSHPPKELVVVHIPTLSPRYRADMGLRYPKDERYRPSPELILDYQRGRETVRRAVVRSLKEYREWSLLREANARALALLMLRND